MLPKLTAEQIERIAAHGVLRPITRRWRSVDTETSRTAAGLMLSKQRIRSLAYGTPKRLFRKLL